MEESHKGVSSTSGAKKNLSLDVDIGEDFITSWKLTDDGKDEMDFSNETPLKVRKTKFNHDKFDDIDFGEDFGKMPSFKMNMDMSDLDFNSPLKKTEDPRLKLGKDPVQGKREVKQGLFSFNFEFDELDSFGIDTNFLKNEKKSDNKRLDSEKTFGVDDKGNAPDSKCNSINSINEVNFHGCISPKNTSKSNEVIGSDSGKELRHVDVASHTNHSAFNEENIQGSFRLVKEIAFTEQNNSKKKSDGRIERPDMMTSENFQERDGAQVFSAPSSDKLTFKILTESQLENVGNLPVCESITKPDKSAESLGSPDPRGSSCVKTSNLEYPPTFVGESSDDVSKSEAQQNNKNEAIKERAADSDIKEPHVMNTKNAPISSTLLSKSGCRQTKSSDDNHSSILMNPSLSLHEFKKQMPVSQKENAFNLQSKLEEKISKQCSALNPNPKPNSPVSTINIEREPSTSSGEIVREVCINEEADKELPFLGYDQNKKENPISIATKQPNNHKPSVRCLSSIGGHALLKPSIGSVKNVVVSLKADTRSNDNSLNISRLKKSTTPLANFTNKRKSNLLGVSDIDAESRSRKTPIVTFSKTTEKPLSSSLSLKRRSFQGLTADPTPLKSLKFPQSPSKKRICMNRPVDISLHSVFNSEELEDYVVDVPIEPQEVVSVDIPSKMGMLDLEVPIVLEEDDHVQKAESCAKELDDIYKMLKKKHEEAKEIMVRAIVNNNHMLMLNHPINEQKICSLQKLTQSLISLKFT